MCIVCLLLLDVLHHAIAGQRDLVLVVTFRGNIGSYAEPHGLIIPCLREWELAHRRVHDILRATSAGVKANEAISHAMHFVHVKLAHSYVSSTTGLILHAVAKSMPACMSHDAPNQYTLWARQCSNCSMVSGGFTNPYRAMYRQYAS